MKNGDFAGSVKSYTESIKRDPNDPRGYNNRAAAYTKLTALPEALKDVETAIKVDPKFGELFYYKCGTRCPTLTCWYLVKAYIRKSNVLFAMREYTKAMEAAQEVSKHAEQDINTAANGVFQALDVDTEKQHTKEIEQQMEKVGRAIYDQQSGESDEQTLQRAMRDPEVAVSSN